MKVLISNDDGVQAPGLLALYEALSKIAEVKVVAPDTEQSGCASALSISKPLYIQELASGFIAVNGSPADCVYLALHELYREIEFDCVITGINSAANLGQDVLFSGTFGAALTAQLFGVPAIATSIVSSRIKDDSEDQANHYAIAAQAIVKLVSKTDWLAALRELPYHVLNVNIPYVEASDELKGCKLTQLGHDQIAKPVHRMVDPRGRDAYWLSLRKLAPVSSKLSVPVPVKNAPDEFNQPHNDEGIGDTMTDIQAVAEGYISLSAVKLHHTPNATLATLSNLKL